MNLSYLWRRLRTFVLILWITATLNFILPRLALAGSGWLVPGSVQALLGVLEGDPARIENSPGLMAFRAKLGIGEAVWRQYLKYLWSMARFDLGYSLAHFPATVNEIIATALPYTITLLLVSTLLAFVLGSVVGALLVWRATPGATRWLLSLLMILAPIPSYLMGLILLSLFAFRLPLFPSGGITAIGRVAAGSYDFIYVLDVVHHSILPALSVILTSFGGWALRTRGVMVTVLGEDYLTLAEAKGLSERRMFVHYALRNALLPGVTELAISLGNITSGLILVEVIFAYPGLGRLLYQSIFNLDYTLMQGVVYTLVLTVASGLLIIDLLYPRLDPRIAYTSR